MADIVLWHPRFFGVKPELVIKGGFIAWGNRGEGNASIPDCEPVHYGPAFGALGHAAARLSAFFVLQASLESGLERRLGSRRSLLPVRNVRGVAKRNMNRNSLNPEIQIDPRTAHVLVDGTEITSEAVTEVPLNRLYMLS